MKVGLLILNAPTSHMLTSIVYDTVDAALVSATEFLENNGWPIGFIQLNESEYKIDLCDCHEDVLYVSNMPVIQG